MLFHESTRSFVVVAVLLMYVLSLLDCLSLWRPGPLAFVGGDM